jgi:hypothetical protein
VWDAITAGVEAPRCNLIKPSTVYEMTIMTISNSNEKSHEYQVRELTASFEELYRASWYILDVAKVLFDSIEVEGSKIGSLTPVVAVGLLETIESAALKVINLADRLKETSDAKESIDWGDIHAPILHKASF